jgi:hypothetical protein
VDAPIQQFCSFLSRHAIPLQELAEVQIHDFSGGWSSHCNEDDCSENNVGGAIAVAEFEVQLQSCARCVIAFYSHDLC